MNVETFREYCLRLPLATEDMPFDDNVLVFRICGKIFACITFSNPNLCTMKCAPEKAIDLRERYKAIDGAFHWNKKHWNQIRFNEDADDKLIFELIDHAYNEVKNGLPAKTRKTIDNKIEN